MALELPQMTESQNDKEVTSNDADARLEGALANITSIAMADADVDLTTPAANVDLALSNLYFRMTGALTADRDLDLPDASNGDGKLYIVENATTGGFNVLVQRGAGGATVAVEPGNTEVLYNDGADVINIAVAIDFLDDLSDVNAPSPTQDQVLTYDASAGEWQAQDPQFGADTPVSHALIQLSADQTVNLANGDQVEFDTIVSSPDVLLDATTNVGRVTLPEGKLFEVRAFVRAQFSGATGRAGFEWQDITDAAAVGAAADVLPVTQTAHESSSGVASALIDTSDGPHELELQIRTPTALTAVDLVSHVVVVEVPRHREAPFLGATASLTADESISDSTPTEIPWDQLDEEVGDWGSLSTATDLVVPDGVERVRLKVQIPWAADAVGERTVEFLLNGAVFSPEIIEQKTTAELDATDTTLQTLASYVAAVSPGDTLSVRVTQTSGGPLNILGTIDRAWFSVEAVKGVGESRVEGPAAFIETPEAKTYVLDQSAEFPYRIERVIHQMGSGSLDFTIEIDGTPVTGLDGPETSTTTEATSTATASNDVPVGGRVTLVVSSPSSPEDFAFTMRIVRL